MFFPAFLTVFLFAGKAFANPACAVCTIAVGASLELARYLGVADTIVGLWGGAFMALIGYWAILWFDKKKWNFFGRNALLMLLSVGSIGFLYMKDLVYTPQPIFYIFYMDPFLFCSIAGALLLIYSSRLYQWMKQRNGGRAHFPFEKVALPVGALLLASLYLHYFPMTPAF